MTLLARVLVLALAATAAFGSPQPSVDCGNCTFTPIKAELCTEHAKEERTVISEAKQDFKSESGSERVQALRTVAKLSDAHPSCPTRAVAKFLAQGLSDRSDTVRAESLRLLLNGQHPDETVRTLVSELAETQKVLSRFKPGLKAALEYRAVFSKKSVAVFEKVRMFPPKTRYALHLIAALGALPDKRGEKILLKCLSAPVKKAPALVSMAAAGAALQLDSVGAMRAVINFQKQLADALMGNKISQRYTQGKSLTKLDGWLAYDRELRQEDFDLLSAALIAAVEAKGLKDHPGPDLSAARDWKPWFELNKSSYQAKFLKKLGVKERVAPAPFGFVE